MKRVLSGASTLLLAALAAASAHADTLVVLEDKALDTGDSEESKNVSAQMRQMWIGKGQYRLDADGKQHDGKKANGTEIFRDDKLYLLNFQDKSYTVLDREGLARGKGAREREQFAAAGAPPATIRREIRRTARASIAGGLPCHEWEVYENDKLRQVQCLTPLLMIASGQALRETMVRYTALHAGFEDSTTALPWTDVEKTESFPMRVTDYEDGKAIGTSVVVRLDAKAIPMLGTYEIPPGMKEGTKYE